MLTRLLSRFLAPVICMPSLTLPALVLALTLSADVSAADRPAQDNRTEAEKKFEGLLDKLAAFLDKSPAYTVEIKTSWQTTGLEKESQGSNRCKLTVQNPGKFRLEFQTGKATTPNLICVSDGKMLTRLLPSKRLYSQASNPRHELRRCSLTLSHLQGVGPDLFLHPEMPEYALTQARNIEDKGIAEIEGSKAHHFTMTWGTQGELELWLDAGQTPLPKKFTTTRVVPYKEKKTFKLRNAGTLTWQVGGAVPAESFLVSLPKGARKVEDLLTALLDGGLETLLGKPAPEVELARLDGGAWKLGSHKGKEVVVLFFWASWAAPSVAELPELRKFVEEFREKGVVFYAINVGEKEEEVKEFVRKNGWKTPVVLDPDGKATDAYHVTAIPVSVLVGKDGTVQAFRTGSKPEEAQKMRKALDALLKGESLVPGDRPPK